MRHPESTHPSGAVALSGSARGGALVPVEHGWEIDLGDLPRDPTAATTEGRARVAAAVETAAGLGGGRLRLWVRGPDDAACHRPPPA